MSMIGFEDYRIWVAASTHGIARFLDHRFPHYLHLVCRIVNLLNSLVDSSEA